MPRPARPWFRYYSEALESRKTQSLKPALFKHWINLLSLANITQPRGHLPPIPDIAFAFRPMTLNQVTAAVCELVDLHFIDQTDAGEYVMHQWEDWQKESDADLTPGRSEGRARRPNQAARAAVAPPLRRANHADAPPLRRGSAAERRGEEIREETEGEGEETRARDPFNIYRLCEQFYGRAIGTLEIQTLKDMEEAYPAECLTHAFQEASDLNKKSLRYVAAICKRHKETGCFVDLRPGTATAQGNGVAEPSGIHIRGYEPPDFVLDP